MKRVQRIGVVSYSALIASTLCSVPAFAQSAQPGSAGLSDIVVTAQRREQVLQDVPLSVAAVSGEKLLERNFGDPAQLQFVAPNLQYTAFLTTPGAVNFSVRGIGTATFSHAIEPTVATVIDGIVMGRPEMGVMQFYDLERVEILSGPQGTLFGKNASAGLINIVTARPKLGEAEFKAHGELATINAARECCQAVVQTAANLPVGDDSAVRLNAYYSAYDDLVTNIQNVRGTNLGLSQYGFRGKYLWKPEGGLSVLVAGDYTHSTGMGVGASTLRQVAPGSVMEADAAAQGIEPGPNNVHTSTLDAATNQKFKVFGIQGEIEYEFPDGITLTNIAGYRKFKSFRTSGGDLTQTLYAELENVFDQFSNELRFASPSGGNIEYQGGLYFYAAEADRRDFVTWDLRGALDPLPPGFTNAAGFHAQNNVDTKSYAAFGQISVKLADPLRVILGGRVTHDRLTLDGAHDQDGFVIPFGVPAGTYNVKLKAKHTDFSWRATAQYDFTPDIMGYVTVADGYKGPGFNTSYSFGGSVVNPEFTTSYEAGLKSSFSNFVVNIAAYWQEVKGLQTSGFLPQISTFLITNAGSLRARGVELDMRFKPAPGLTFSAGGAFNDAVFRSYRGAQCYSGQTAALGCVGGVTDATGNRLANAPKWSGNFAVDYEREISSALMGRARFDVYGRTKVNFSSNNDPSTVQKGYAIVNGSLGIGSISDSWRLNVFCRNCFDKRFVTFISSAFPGGALNYSQVFGLTSFRAIGLSADLRF